jgi:hypothetical protein
MQKVRCRTVREDQRGGRAQRRTDVEMQLRPALCPAVHYSTSELPCAGVGQRRKVLAFLERPARGVQKKSTITVYRPARLASDDPPRSVRHLFAAVGRSGRTILGSSSLCREDMQWYRAIFPSSRSHPASAFRGVRACSRPGGLSFFFSACLFTAVASEPSGAGVKRGFKAVAFPEAPASHEMGYAGTCEEDPFVTTQHFSSAPASNAAEHPTCAW